MRPTGLEPVTSALGKLRSIRVSYGRYSPYILGGYEIAQDASVIEVGQMFLWTVAHEPLCVVVETPCQSELPPEMDGFNTRRFSYAGD